MKKNKGITLVALVVTIVILLILAGISISALTNQGLFKNAKSAKEQSAKANARESIILAITEWHMENAANNTSIEDFFTQKVTEGEIDSFEPGDEEGTYNIYKDGFVLTIDSKGNIVEEIQKSGPRPKTSNLKITTDGKTEPEDRTVSAGTPLIINFDASIEGGKIKSITPNIPYTTNGTENEVIFTIIGVVDGEEYNKTFKVFVGNKYNYPEPEMSNVKITTNGTTVPDDKTVARGTKLQIDFDITVSQGNIKSITPTLPYTTNGAEKEVEFTILITSVDNTEYEKTFKVSTKSKYVDPTITASNTKITTNGTTVPEDYSQRSGTKLQIDFSTSINEGTIKSVTPSLPYTTNGTERSKTFTIVGTTDGEDYTKTYTVDINSKYLEKITTSKSVKI